MEPDRVKEIIRSLADGRDPATGKPFPPDSAYQQADTVRALHVALEALQQAGKPHAARPIDPNRPKMGRAWTPQEEEQLIQAYKDRKSIADVAAAHGRTTGAITSRLVKLGLIEDNQKNRAGQGNRPKPPQVSPTPKPDDQYPF